jgi:hypothetical protein
MSMAPLDFTCDGCNYRGSDALAWGYFSYDTPSGLTSVNSGLGWCHQCRNLAPVEILPSLQRIRNIENEIEQEKQKSCAIQERTKESRF